MSKVEDPNRGTSVRWHFGVESSTGILRQPASVAHQAPLSSESIYANAANGLGKSGNQASPIKIKADEWKEYTCGSQCKLANPGRAGAAATPLTKWINGFGQFRQDVLGRQAGTPARDEVVGAEQR